jgi:hypothetical protein
MRSILLPLLVSGGALLGGFAGCGGLTPDDAIVPSVDGGAEDAQPDRASPVDAGDAAGDALADQTVPEDAGDAAEDAPGDRAVPVDAGDAAGDALADGAGDAGDDVDAGPLHPTGAIALAPSVATAHLTTTAPPAGGLPKSVDLSAKIGPPGDQGSESSCVGWAVAYAAKTLQETTEVGWSPSSANHQFSPSWVYNQINGAADGGSSFGEALNLLVSRGADDLSDFPYVDGQYTAQPDANSLIRAARFKAQSWSTILVTEANIKNVLAGGNAVIAGINVLPDWDRMNDSTNPTYDDDSGDSRGYQAIAIIGYEDARGAFRVMNSWGTGWGSNGYGWIAYSFVTNAKLGMSLMVLNDAPNSKSAGIGVFRSGSADEWLLRDSPTEGSPEIDFFYGGQGDKPVVGDWNAGHETTVGLFRPSGTQYNATPNDQWLTRTSNTSGDASVSATFGQADDLPVTGDWDGDGITTIGVFRKAGAPNNTSPGNQSDMWILSNSPVGATQDYVIYYGGDGDLPVVGDWDGNGTTTIGVFRPANTTINGSTEDQWILCDTNTSNDTTLPRITYGAGGDSPIVGDWNGDGTTTIGVFIPAGAPANPSKTENMWVLTNSKDGSTRDYVFFYGAAGDLPIAGNWIHYD